MSQYVTELCELLITDTFGQLYSLIFSYLLHHGRQPIYRIVKNTHLSPRQVSHGLAVLIQQHHVFHSTSVDDGVTYYESNWRVAYNLVRSGKILQIVEERLGQYAAHVVSTLLTLGHAKVSYLESLPDLQPIAQTNGVNGTHSNEEDPDDDLDGENEDPVDGDLTKASNGHLPASRAPKLAPVLRDLAAYGFIDRVRNNHFQSPEDNLESAMRVAKASADGYGLKGKRLEDKIAEEAASKVVEWTDGTILRGAIPGGLIQGKKRRVGNDEPARSNKRRKLERDMDDEGAGSEDGLSDDDYTDEGMPLDSNLIIRVNYEKFDVALRNKRLTEFAGQHTTEVTSRVYETLLSRIELQTPKCRGQLESIPEGEEAEQYSAPVLMHTLVGDLDPDQDLTGVIAGADVNGADEDDEDFDEDDEDEETADGVSQRRGRNRFHLAEQHLSLLAAEPHFFATRKMESGMLAWAVEYRHLARRLRHLELERMIESRFGSVAVRLVRVLQAKGKLDEKRLQEVSLMASKDLRQMLSLMAGAGFIDLQEVPRDTQRQASRTIYLWFYDPDRVSRVVLEDTYKSMSRAMQRIAVERDKIKFILEKTQRTDVKGNEERYLSEGELKLLEEWQETEALLLGEVTRLDDLVAVFRDF